MKFSLRICALVVLSGAGMASAGQAQTSAPAPAAALPAAEDPSIALSRNLATLSQSPNSLDALLGAGRAAVALGDPEAALTFLGRAEELSPRDGRVKAAIGSALVMMEQGRTALRFFEEARGLGTPEADFAGYRGLAYDLTGDPARAQRDYRLALTRREDPEVRRRFALSLAISGNREAALSAIEGQLRRQDRAAWRTRAFILALTGDAAGATQAVQAVMPAQASAMAPFLARLPALSPADRALAVNFGHFPGTGQPQLPAGVVTAQAPTASTIAPPVAQPLATTAPSAARPTTTQPPIASTVRPPSGTAPAPTTVASVPLRPAPVPTSTAIAPGPSSAAVAPPMARALGPVSPTLAPSSTTVAARPPSATVAPPAPSTSAPAGPPLAQTSTTVATSPPSAAVAPPAASASVPVGLTSAPPVAAAAPPPSAIRPSSAPVAPLPSWFALGTPGTAPASGPVLAAPAGQTQSSVLPTPAATSPALVPAPVAAPPSALASTVSIQSTPLAASTLASPGTAPVLAEAAPPPIVPEPAAAPLPTGSSRNFADVATLVSSLSAASDDVVAITPEVAKSSIPLEPETRPAAEARPPAKKPEPAPSKTAVAKPSKPPKEPARSWVQIAHAGSPTVLPGQYERIRSRAPKLFAGRSAWTATQKGTNRLLVGPFKSDKEAKAFVTQLDKANVESFSWASPAGLEIKKLK